MNGQKYPTLAEIKASHAPKVEYDRYLLAGRFLFRPPSFPAIWLLLRLGMTGETASWLSGLFALCGLVCLAWPAGPLLWYGVGFLLLFNFFDCLDGGLARAADARNSYGRFLDSAMWWADMLFWTTVGSAVWRLPQLRGAGDALGLPAETWIYAGVLASFFASYLAYIEGVFDGTLREGWDKLQGASGVKPAGSPYAGKVGPEVLVRALVQNLRVRETHYLLLGGAFALGRADLLLAFYLVFNAFMTVLLAAAYCRRGRRIREAELAERKTSA